MKASIVKWITAFALILLLLLALRVSTTLGTPSVSMNFPLRQVWEARLDSNVLGVSTSETTLILARTEGAIYGLDAQTGREVWRHELSMQADPRPGLARDGIVFISDHDALWAINQQSGLTVWRVPLSNPDSWVVDASQEVVLVNEPGEYINAYSSETGQFLYAVPVIRGDVQAFIDQDKAYIPGYGLTAIELASGKTIWQTQDTNGIAYLDYLNGILFYPSSDSGITAYDARNQNILWMNNIPHPGLPRVKVSGGYLFLATASTLCAIDVTNGSTLWCTSSSYPQDPALIGNIVYVFDGGQKHISAIQMSTGKQIGEIALPGLDILVIYRQLMVEANNTLYFASDQEIFAFGH